MQKQQEKDKAAQEKLQGEKETPEPESLEAETVSTPAA